MTIEAVSDQAAPPMRALEQKALQASVWSILEYGSGMALRVVSSLVLTRLLLPTYFGEITLVSTLIMGMTLLSDIGLAPSVIQSPRGDDPVFLNTAWTIQVLRGVALCLIAVAISWPVAVFYKDPKLGLLLPVLALCTLIGGFNSTNLMTLTRHMGARRFFAIDGSTAVVALVVTITWAHFSPSPWAIVGGQLVSTVYRLCISFIPAVAPGIRNSFAWEKQSVHSILHFGRWILIGTAFTFFATQSDRLILGKLIPLALLGIYGIAYQISDIPRQVILALSYRAAYPFISKIVYQPIELFRAQFLRYRFFALLAGAFILSIMVNWGGLLIVHLYDHRYRDAAWMIPILALGLWQTLLYNTTLPVLLSMGRAKYNALGYGSYCLSIWAGIPIGFHYLNMFGAVIAVAAADLPMYFIVQIGMHRNAVRPWRQDLKMTAVFVAAVLTFHFLKRL